MAHNDDSMPDHLLRRSEFIGRDKQGIPYDTEAEAGRDISQIHPDVDRTLRGEERGRGKIMDHYSQGRVQRRPTTKTITFYFLEAGEESLITLKQDGYLKKHPNYSIPEHSLANEGEDDVDASSRLTRREKEQAMRLDISKKVPRKTCSEYVAFQAPGIIGQKYNHVELCYEEVRLVEEEEEGSSQEVYGDITFTSTIYNNGPYMFKNKPYDPRVYKTVWKLTVSETLFYESYEQMTKFVMDNRGYFEYNFFWFCAIPWLGCCGKNTILNTDNIYSCSRLAADCILSLKLGNDVFFHALREYVGIIPDDVYAILGRFHYLFNKYYGDVARPSIREKEESDAAFAFQRTGRSEPAFPKKEERGDTIFHLMSDTGDYALPDYTSEEAIERDRKVGVDLKQKEIDERRTRRAQQQYKKILEKRKGFTGEMDYIDKAHKRNFIDTSKTNHFNNTSTPLRLNMEAYTIGSELYTITPYKTKE